MSVLNLRIIYIDDKNEATIFRDIEIASNNNFEQLHNFIEEVFNLPKQQLASFYLSDNEWSKGEEITLMPLDDYSDGISEMQKTILSKLINEKGQKLVYVNDFLLHHTFFVEIKDIKTADSKLKSPICTRTFGEIPLDVFDMSNILDESISDELMHEFDNEIYDENEFNNEDDEFGGGEEYGYEDDEESKY